MAMWATAAATCLALAVLSFSNHDDRYWRRWLGLIPWLGWRLALLAIPLGATGLWLALDPSKVAGSGPGAVHGLVVAAASFVAFSSDVNATGSGPLGEARRILLLAHHKLVQRLDDQTAYRTADRLERLVHQGALPELMRVARSVLAALSAHIARPDPTVGDPATDVGRRELLRLLEEMTSGCDLLVMHDAVGSQVITDDERHAAAELLRQQLSDAIRLLRWTSAVYPPRPVLDLVTPRRHR